MPKILKFRRGTTQELSQITGEEGELFVDLNKDTLVVMDGVTQGGSTLQKELVSGTNIKTINGQSLLGGGDLSGLATQDYVLGVTSGLASETFVNESIQNLATETFVNTQIQNVVGAAPVALNTLSELAAALNNDESFASTIISSLGNKQDRLVSGTSIRTINGQSILGLGNINITQPDISGLATESSVQARLDQKQNNLIAGTNIKTINGQSILGSGDISISGGPGNLATVATTGSYDDLVNKPTIPTTTGELFNSTGYITLSQLATVATTGSYNDLVNKPTIPTSTSELTNNSGYVTFSQLAVKQDALISGTSIKTINGQDILGSGNIIIAQPMTTSQLINDSSYVTVSELNSKQDSLVSGTNIKTVNGQSILGDGNLQVTADLTGYATQSFVELRLNTRQEVLESGGNIKTINGQSILGNGNLEVTADLTGYATETFVNNRIQTVVGAAPAALDTLSELAAALGNDSNYAATITNALSSKANSSALSSVAFSGSYNDLNNKPYIPTTTLDLINSAGFVTGSQLFTKQDTLVSGDNIKTINGQSLLGSGNIIIAGEGGSVPSNISAFTNDVGYVTAAVLGQEIATRQPALVSGNNIKTINGQSILGAGNIAISGGGGLDFGTFTSPAGFTLDMGTF